MKMFADRIEFPNGQVLKGIVGDVEDGFVVESGSNANGSWTKFADGTMIVEKEITINTAVATAYGSLYANNTSSTIAVGDFPQQFIAPPVEIPALSELPGQSNVSAWLSQREHATATVGGSYFFIRPVSVASALNYSLKIIAKGRWKE